MPKMTVLDMTQNILSAIDGDEVNSIGDSVESMQVAEILRETYYELCAGLSIPSREGLVLLDAFSDSDKPNYMAIPNNVKSVKWIKYDFRTDDAVDYRDVTYMDPESFLLRTTSSGASGNVETVSDASGAKILVRTDANPTYWTTFDNKFIVFDSYLSSLDTSLQQSKTMCWGQFDPVFEMSDTFIPELDADEFPLLLAEAKSVAFINLKQVSSSKEEQRARRQRVRSQNDQWRGHQREYFRVPDYGRKTR